MQQRSTIVQLFVYIISIFFVFGAESGKECLSTIAQHNLNSTHAVAYSQDHSPFSSPVCPYSKMGIELETDEEESTKKQIKLPITSKAFNLKILCADFQHFTPYNFLHLFVTSTPIYLLFEVFRL